MGLELYQILLIGVITVFASYIQGVTGFGFGIFSMIFLPSILQYTEANILASMLSALTSAIIVLVAFRKITWKNLFFPLLGCLITTYIAVAFIESQNNETLSLLLGIVLLLLSVYFFFFSEKIKIRPTWYAGLITGIISGLMEGMFSIGGPPAVIYFLQSEEDSDHYLSTISAYFVFSGLISVGTKAVAGFITLNVWIGLAIGILGMLFGSFVGKKTRDHIKPVMIKKAVYGVMAISGVVNIVTALL